MPLPNSLRNFDKSSNMAKNWQKTCLEAIFRLLPGIHENQISGTHSATNLNAHYFTISLFLGAQKESGNHTRQKSLRRRETRSTIKIEDNGTRVTLAFSPLDAKNYSLTSSKPRCDWEKFMSPKYRCLSRAVLTILVVFLTFLTIYVITIYGFKFTNDPPHVSSTNLD